MVKKERGGNGLRETVIRFLDDNNIIRDLDENRHYFLTEADDLLEKIKKNIQQNGWLCNAKKYNFYLNGMYILQGSFSFDSETKLSDQIYDVIKKNTNMDSEKKKELLKILKHNKSEELRLFSNKELSYFAIELSKLMSQRKFFLFSLKQTEKMFSVLQLKMRESFFSKMEDVKKAINKSFDLLLVYENLWHGSYEEIHKRLERWFAFEDNFNKYLNLFVSTFFSIPESRLKSQLRKSRTYNKLQYYLFEICAKHNFYESMKKQMAFEREINRRRTEVLMKGIPLDSEVTLQNQVIDYTIRQFFIHEQKQDSLLSAARNFCDEYLNPERKHRYE